MSDFERFFRLQEHGTTVGTKVWAGEVTLPPVDLPAAPAILFCVVRAGG